MLALTFISKSQYRDIVEKAQNMNIDKMRETFGVMFPMKVQQYQIVDILESSWSAYKEVYRHAPKDSDDFFEFITEKMVNIVGLEDDKPVKSTIWDYGIDKENALVEKYNSRKGEEVLPKLEDNAYTRAVLYTHIKAKIGDWEDY